MFMSTYARSTQRVSLNSLCGYWKLDETTKTLADDAYSTRDGSMGSTVICASSGKINTGFNFKVATGSHVMLPADASSQMGTSDFTMSAWVYPTSLPATTWKGYFGGDPNAFVWGSYGTDLWGAKNGVAGTPATGLTMSLNTWQFVAVVFDSTATTQNLIFYRNDSSVKLNFDYNFDAGYTNYLGLLASEDSNHLEGNMDEVGIWKRKLTTAEIAALYNSGNGLSYPFIS